MLFRYKSGENQMLMRVVLFFLEFGINNNSPVNENEINDRFSNPLGLWIAKERRDR